MKKTGFWLFVILAAATVLRLYNLTAISLWHDEAFSALLINYSWSEMFYRIGLDVHPPIYYVLLRLWADLFGHSLGSLRGFSAFFGIATVYSTYLFVKTAFKNKELALFASALVALHPFQIQYVTEARMYTLGAFLLITSAYYLVRAFELQKEFFELKNAGAALPRALARRLWLNWLLFAITTSLQMYTHYYLFFSVIALGLFGIYHLIKNYGLKLSAYKYLLTSYALVLLAFVPWLKTFAFQFSQVQENYWIPKINAWSIPLTNWRMIFGTAADSAKPLTKFALAIGLIFTIWVIARVYKKVADPEKKLVLLALVVPFIGAALLSLKQSIFLDRYFLFASLFYTIALALFISSFGNKYFRYGFFALIALLLLNNYAKEWRQLDVKNHRGIAAASNFLNNNVAASDRLIVNTSFEFFNFKYYNRTPLKALLYAPGINKVSDLPHFSGTAILTDQDLLHDLNYGAKKGQTAWILWTNAFGGSKSAVPQNWLEKNEYSWADIRPYSGTSIFVTEYIIN